MAMPQNLVLIRHGHSEANHVQAMNKANPGFTAPEGFHNRHDSLMRLSRLGVQQAVAAGEWLREQFPDGFDSYFTSPHTRAVETAGNLALGGTWNLDDRLRERDWGEYGVLSDQEREVKYKISHDLKGQNKWYWCPAGGESLATGVRLRYRSMLETLDREHSGKSVLAVVHGEVIDVAKFEHERPTPSEWLLQDRDPGYKVANCQIVQYSCQDPETGENIGKLRWRRSVCPWNKSRSWNNGEWVRLDRKRYSDQELLAMAEIQPRLLSED